MRLRVQGGQSFALRLRKLRGAIDKAALRALTESAEELRDELRAELTGRGVVSRPGNPPARDSGRLEESLFVEVDKAGLSARIGTDLDYGRHLEFGTSRMAARPWLFPTFERLKPRITARVASALRDAVRAAGRR